MIERIIIIALIVFAIWYSMQEGEIFYGLAQWLEKHLPEAIHKPVFGCHVCMTPWYGSVVYGFIWGATWWIPVYVIAAMGFNAIHSKLWAKDEVDVIIHYPQSKDEVQGL